LEELRNWSPILHSSERIEFCMRAVDICFADTESAKTAVKERRSSNKDKKNDASTLRGDQPAPTNDDMSEHPVSAPPCISVRVSQYLFRVVFSKVTIS